MRLQRFRGNTRHLILITACLVLIMLAVVRLVPSGHAAPAPKELSDQQFWSLSKEFSEEDGVFRSDNLLSNETSFQYVIPNLLKATKEGRVYLGVGPEQNFTYIAALKPAMAIIIDIRHGNLDVHLMYKALFELSKDRAEFVSRLFSRKRPNGLTDKTSVTEIFNAYLAADGNKEMFEENLRAIQDVLIKKHGFPLTSGDIDGIRWALSNYYQFGPAINYSSSLSASTPPEIVGAIGGGFGNNGVTYASLMTAEDGLGQNRSFLASQENFDFLKDLESRNLVIPVVGDFGGNKAIRAVATYLKSIDAMVSAFYLSNVEQFLGQGGKWRTFCASTAMLPLDDTSFFIRSGGGRNIFGGGGVQNSSISKMFEDLTPCLETAH